jgi:hypothetical protein
MVACVGIVCCEQLRVFNVAWFFLTPTSLYSSPLVGCLVVLGQLLQLQLYALPQSD